MNDKIKTAVNLGALILVPLINERHRLKDHPDYVAVRDKTVHTAAGAKDMAVKAKDKTVHTSRKVVDTSKNVKEKTVAASQFVAGTAHHIQENRKENKRLKETKQMNRQLDKAIQVRQKEEEKRLKIRQKEMKKALEQANKDEKKKRKSAKKQSPKAVVPFAVRHSEHEEDYSNAPLFDKHRKEMAEHIERRAKF